MRETAITTVGKESFTFDEANGAFFMATPTPFAGFLTGHGQGQGIWTRIDMLWCFVPWFYTTSLAHGKLIYGITRFSTYAKNDKMMKISIQTLIEVKKHFSMYLARGVPSRSVFRFWGWQEISAFGRERGADSASEAPRNREQAYSYRSMQNDKMMKKFPYKLL